MSLTRLLYKSDVELNIISHISHICYDCVYRYASFNYNLKTQIEFIRNTKYNYNTTNMNIYNIDFGNYICSKIDDILYMKLKKIINNNYVVASLSKLYDYVNNLKYEDIFDEHTIMENINIILSYSTHIINIIAMSKYTNMQYILNNPTVLDWNWYIIISRDDFDFNLFLKNKTYNKCTTLVIKYINFSTKYINKESLNMLDTYHSSILNYHILSTRKDFDMSYICENIKFNWNYQLIAFRDDLNLIQLHKTTINKHNLISKCNRLIMCINSSINFNDILDIYGNLSFFNTVEWSILSNNIRVKDIIIHRKLPWRMDVIHARNDIKLNEILFIDPKVNYYYLTSVYIKNIDNIIEIFKYKLDGYSWNKTFISKLINDENINIVLSHIHSNLWDFETIFKNIKLETKLIIIHNKLFL